MQHNFVFQLIFYPSQDKFSRFQTSRISENKFTDSPNTDANLLLIQTPQLRDVPDTNTFLIPILSPTTYSSTNILGWHL